MWTSHEKRLIKIYFEKYIKAARAPGKNICEKFFEDKQHLYPNISWTNIKDCVRNMGLKEKKNKMKKNEGNKEI